MEIKDYSGNAVTSGAAATANLINADMSILNNNEVSKVTLKGSCIDPYGQQ